MDGVNRWAECVFPHTYPEISQEIPQVHSGISALSVYCSPLWANPAPLVFTQVMAVPAAYLRRMGLSVFPYLDNWLIKANSLEMVTNHLNHTTTLLHEVGFSINRSQSHVNPLKRIQFIGAVFDTTVAQDFPPPQRIQDI